MSSRRFSRPRTRIYDVNYNIGNSYYQPTIDRLDRKYSGRPLSPAARQTSLPKDLQERHDRAFADDDLESARARAHKRISEVNAFDSRGGIVSKALEMVENDLDEETALKLQRIRANKKVSVIDDIDLDQTMNNIKARRIKDRAEQMLDSVGIATIDNTERNKKLNDITYARRTLKVTTVDSSNADSNDLVKWTKFDSGINAAKEENTAASIRAKQSRARLNELEDEMNEMAEKAQVRERRAARLRQLVAETAENSDVQQQSSSVRISGRQKREAIEF